MHAQRALVAILLIASGGWGCGEKKPPGQPEPVTASAPRCTSADDCRLSNHRAPTDCCGDLCEHAEPYHRQALATVEAEPARNCKPGGFTCPVADCDVPRNLYPGCRDGACVAVELPRR